MGGCGMNLNKTIRGILSVAALVGCFGHVESVRADVRLPRLFSDNLVLQQEASVTVWGWADDGEKVTVSFRNQQVSTTAADGKWMVTLKKLKAGGPDVLKVSGKNMIELKNVLVGEVWVCSGQSNMEFKLKTSFHSEADIAAATNSLIRFFHVPKLRANEPTNDVPTAWQECTPMSAADITAVGYYFGRDLQAARHVPIGLIESDWGGTPAEAWTRHEILESNPRYKREILDTYEVNVKNHDIALAKFKQEEADAKAKGEKVKTKAPGTPWKPSELYNGMIAPLTNYTIKGAIWYQGEANAGRAEQYRSLFADMITNWRADWREGNFPFFCVQLAPFQPIKEQPADSAWAELREAQYLVTKKLPNAGMAVITDIGDPGNIHPVKKQPVGARLALAARGIAYGEKIVYSGPIYKSMKVEGSKVVLTFDHVGAGLVARDGQLEGFAICGEDHKFVWANAVIDGKHVTVSSASVEHPVAVRYGWADSPVVNLWNKDGLPASPFRTDDFPMVTLGK
jgi:sialate O-acetylesterase